MIQIRIKKSSNYPGGSPLQAFVSFSADGYHLNFNVSATDRFIQGKTWMNLYHDEEKQIVGFDFLEKPTNEYSLPVTFTPVNETNKRPRGVVYARAFCEEQRDLWNDIKRFKLYKDSTGMLLIDLTDVSMKKG